MKTHMKRSSTWIAIFTAVALVGCGSGGDTASETPPETNGDDAATDTGGTGTDSVDETGAAGEPIRLGVSLSDTGRFAESAASMRQAYDLWAEQTNDEGGIEGSPVELVYYDDESEPDTARVLAERLINQDDVLMLLGPYSSGITGVMAAVSEREEVPLLGTIASDRSTWAERDLSWTFQAFAASRFDHQGFMEIAAENGVESMGLLYEETPFSIDAMDWAVEEGGPELGIEIEAISYQADDLNFSAAAQRFGEAGVAAISMGGYVAPGIQFTQTLMEQGVSPEGYQFIQAGDEAAKEGLGDAVEGVIGRTPWHPELPTEGNEDFVATYSETYGEDPDYQAATAFATGQTVAAAISAAGRDRQGIRDFLANETVDTVMGTYEVDERLAQVGYRYAVTQWQDGNNVLVGGENVENPADVIWPKPEW